MNARLVAYWITTALFALAIAGSGTMNLLQPPELVAVLEHLGYPAYLGSILGTWKLLGAVAILAPGLPRLKEWAYAGFTFALSGATISHLVSGDPVGQAAAPLVLLSFALASWALRPEGRRLG